MNTTLNMYLKITHTMVSPFSPNNPDQGIINGLKVRFNRPKASNHFYSLFFFELRNHDILSTHSLARDLQPQKRYYLLKTLANKNMATTAIATPMFSFGLRICNPLRSIRSTTVHFSPLTKKQESSSNLSSSRCVSGFAPLVFNRTFNFASPIGRNLQPLTVVCAKGYKMKTHKAILCIFIFADTFKWTWGTFWILFCGFLIFFILEF